MKGDALLRAMLLRERKYWSMAKEERIAMILDRLRYECDAKESHLEQGVELFLRVRMQEHSASIEGNRGQPVRNNVETGEFGGLPYRGSGFQAD